MYPFRKFKEFIKKFFLINDTPHKVAAGAALGIFMGIIPGGVITALVLASIFRFNRLAAGVSALAFSVWTTAIVSPIAAGIGGFLFSINTQSLASDFNRIQQMELEDVISHQFVPVILDLALPLAVGLVIVGGAIALAFYFLILYLLKRQKIRFK